MFNLARFLLIGGVILILASGVVYLLGRLNIPIGRLPGDIRLQTENMTCFIPLASMIVISVLLTILLNVIIRLMNK
jgi:hypothetical protein